jgi:hypothetical protein
MTTFLLQVSKLKGLAIYEKVRSLEEVVKFRPLERGCTDLFQ